MPPGQEGTAFDRDADALRDRVRMNDIAPPFDTAFLDLPLEGDTPMSELPDLEEVAEEGVRSVAEDGTLNPAHIYWKGFPERTALVFRLETRAAG
jgi:hypothetical protein